VSCEDSLPTRRLEGGVFNLWSCAHKRIMA
jgi:hypothetical protein